MLFKKWVPFPGAILIKVWKVWKVLKISLFFNNNILVEFFDKILKKNFYRFNFVF